MPRRAAQLAVLVAALALALPAGAAVRTGPAQGTLTHATYTEPGGLTRGYYRYVPAGLKPGAPLVMFLHGCNETALQTIQATHYDQLADRKGFAVVYPEQVVPVDSSAPLADGNGVGCWNWFLPQDQVRGGPEPAVLTGLVQHVAAQLRSDRRRIYVSGISAGADMTVILAATYPDVYAAAASLAGCAYRTCGDQTGELTYQAMGSRARLVPLLVENGTADSLNPAPQSVGLAQSWLGLADLADDGTMDGSFSRQPASYRTTVYGGPVSPGSGDACVHNDSFLCPGGVLGLANYPVTVSTWADRKGHDVLELWLVHGMAHAHPDAPGDGPYTDPLGPDITSESYRFFQQQRLP